MPWRIASSAVKRRGALAIQPDVEVHLAEPPLPSNANRGDFPGFYQAVNSTQIDMEVLQYLFRREEHVILASGGHGGMLAAIVHNSQPLQR